MATYNGEPYLRDQIESLINQENVTIDILVGDDGSTDKTRDILKEYFDAGKIVAIHEFNRVGINLNFLNLLKFCSQYDYVAFADQDDIWETTKLYRLVELLGGEKPELAFCQRTSFGSVRKKHRREFPSENKIGFRNALVENVAPGNTVLLNQKAVELILRSNALSAKFYDSYIYLLVSALGEIKYLPISLVNYRIHDNNAVGIRKNSFTNSIEGVRSYILNAKLLKSEFSNLLEVDKLDLLEDFLSGFQEKNKLKSIYRMIRIDISRQRTLDQLAWRGIAILLSLRSKPD